MIQPVIKTLIKAYIKKHPHPLDTDFDGDYLSQQVFFFFSNKFSETCWD